MTDPVALFAAVFAALYVAHHIGDYWVQTDSQARTKGCGGRQGVRACLAHVLTYTLTQFFVLLGTLFALGYRNGSGVFWGGIVAALTISAGTHYLADRREYGLMFRLARLLPGKANFMKLGVPRAGLTTLALSSSDYEFRDEVSLDNSSLGTGAWALDQSWHIALGCWVPALIIAALSRFS